MKIKITKQCNCEDWKTSLVHPKPDLKVGTIIEVGEMTNWYGSYYEGRHDGHFYYISKQNAQPIGE